jgi:hypothetical protein
MDTQTANVHAEAERIANEVFGTKPTPEEIDTVACNYLFAKERSAEAAADVQRLELELVCMVKEWGIVPPHAEKSRRLQGKLAELTVTKADTLTVADDRVNDLRDALTSVGHQKFFGKLFTLRSKWEIVDGAESALKQVALPKRLAEKVMNLWGRCISVKPKKPSLKVTIADPAKPAKKVRTKKGGE